MLRYLYFPKDENGAGSEAPAVAIPRRQYAPWTMLGPMVAITAGIVLLGLFNGEIVERFIEPSMPAGLLASEAAR